MISLRTTLVSMIRGSSTQTRRVEAEVAAIGPSVSGTGMGWPWPSELVTVIATGLALGAQVLIVVAVLLKPTWVDPPLAAIFYPFHLKLAKGDERDQTLYHLGLVLIAIVGTGFVWLNRFLDDRGGRQSRSPVRSALTAASRIVVLGGLLAQGVVPALIPATAHAFTGLGPAVGFLVLSVAVTAVSFTYGLYWRDPGHRLATVRVGGTASDAKADIRVPRSSPRWIPAVAMHGVTVVLIVAALYVPDLPGFVGYMQGQDAEPFHSWDFFAMAPGHAFLLGLTPIIDSYSQYGIGIPIVMADLARLVGGFSYTNVIGVAIMLAIPYYLGVYALAWIWTRSSVWSVFGVNSAILLQVYSGRFPGVPIWVFPSSTYLRAPLDVF